MSLIKFKLWQDINFYVCEIENQMIPPEFTKEIFSVTHQMDLDYVTCLTFNNCKFTTFPKNLGNIFKNIKRICNFSSDLRQISKEDLQQFPNLEDMSWAGGKLESLPGDLFKFNRKMKNIWLSYHEIKHIGPELLDGLKYLEMVDFSKNPGIDIWYSCHEPSISIKQLKKELKKIFKPQVQEKQQQEIQQVIDATKAQKVEDSPLYIEKQVEFTGGNFREHFLEDLDSYLALDEFKDFTIKVEQNAYKVHKFLFIARSETFAELIKNNPEVTEMVLTDISSEIFESILKFIYTDELPENEGNVREIHAAASKLKMEKLKKVSTQILENEKLRSSLRMGDKKWSVKGFGTLIMNTLNLFYP